MPYAICPYGFSLQVHAQNDEEVARNEVGVDARYPDPQTPHLVCEVIFGSIFYPQCGVVGRGIILCAHLGEREKAADIPDDQV